MKKQVSTPYGKAKVYSAESQLPEAELVLVLAGYSETLAHNKKVVDALAANGYNASTFSPPRRSGKEDYNAKDPIQRLASVVLGMVEATIPHGKKVHVAAHSQAVAAALRAAQLNPERFASLTLMQPVGMVGEQDFPELLGRVSKKVARNQVGALRGQDPRRRPEAATIDAESAIRYSARVALSQVAGSAVLAKNPKLALQEATAAGSYDIAEDIARVAELGIPIHIVKAQGDEMFDSNKVDVGYAAIADLVDSYSSVADPNARHDTFWLQPKRTAAIIRQVIQNS